MKEFKTVGRTVIQGKPFPKDTSLRLSEEDAKPYIKAGTLIEVGEDGEPVEKAKSRSRKTSNAG